MSSSPLAPDRAESKSDGRGAVVEARVSSVAWSLNPHFLNLPTDLVHAALTLLIFISKMPTTNQASQKHPGLWGGGGGDRGGEVGHG